MRGGNAANPRQDWYDRNPLPVLKTYSATAAPHALTVRWSYTVPASRKSYLESGQEGLMRGAAAAPADFAAASVRYTPNGGSVGFLLQAALQDNTAGNQSVQAIGASILGFAGDLFEGTTQDGSTGGSIIYRLFSKFTEFDA